MMERFKLKKVILLDGGGVSATFHEKYTAKKEEYWIEKTIKSTIPRHPDLDKVIKQLSIHVASLYGVGGLINAKEETALSKEQRKALKIYTESINITSVTFTGEEDTFGATISATKEVFTDKSIKLTTPTIVFSEEQYAKSLDVGGICITLIDEVYEYLFKHKYAQLDLFAEGIDG